MLVSSIPRRAQHIEAHDDSSFGLNEVAKRSLQVEKDMDGGFHCDWFALSTNLTTFVNPTIIPPIPSYWINLAQNTDRRDYMKTQLSIFGQQLGVGENTRIEGIMPGLPSYRVQMLEKPCNRNTESDIAIILSHLTAIYRAIKDTSPAAMNSPYALILEDDVDFHANVDMRHVISTAPVDFGILQLTTTNKEALSSLWDAFEASGNSMFWTRSKWSDTTKNGKYTLYWGALGYIINKKVVEPFIDDVVEVDSQLGLSFKIVNSFFQQKCERTRARPCVLANCLFSDSYVYSGAGPTYVARFPLITSGKAMGLNSTVHQTHIQAHLDAFELIQKRLLALRATSRHIKCKQRRKHYRSLDRKKGSHHEQMTK